MSPSVPAVPKTIAMAKTAAGRSAGKTVVALKVTLRDV